MPDMLIRNLEPATVEELRARAKRNHRSVAAEAKAILEDATRSRTEAFERLIKLSDKMLAETHGKWTGDSTELIREDRESH
jgi:antitoxin FitA